MPEYWYEWNKEYEKTNTRPPDPKFQCAFVNGKGNRCTRKTTVIYCNQHADIVAKILNGTYKNPKD